MEAVGLGLAIFPVAVTCAQQWVEGAKLIREWRAWKPRLRSYMLRLKTERVKFLNTIEQLLNEIAVSEDEIAELISDPKSPIWKSEEYKEKLQKRLGRSYQPLMESMKELLDVLETIADRLQVVSSKDSSVLEREFQRLKATLLKKDYEELIQQVERVNHNILLFTNQSRAVQKERRKRYRAKPHADFKKIRRQARSLYNVCIKRSWTCQCRSRHIVNLRLEPRPWSSEDGDVRRDSRERFVVLLWNEVLSTPVPKWTHRRVQIESIEVLSDSPIPHEDQTPTLRPKAVKFTDNLPPQVLPAMQISSSLPGLSPPAVPISDLCEALAQTPAIEYIGFLTDEQHRHSLFSIGSAEPSPTVANKISLEELLERSTTRLQSYYMSRRDRLYLAIVIASSVLQLNGTQWLQPTFRSSDILFFHCGDSKVDFAHPYLSQQVALPEETSHSQENTAADLVAHLIRSKPLFALGQRLIELSLNQTIAPLLESQHEDLVSMAMALQTTHDLIPQVEGESGIRYGDIVRRCLDCPFEVRLRDLDSEEFQQAIFDRIIVPLTEELKNFDGVATAILSLPSTLIS